jgi:hypothetical protein
MTNKNVIFQRYPFTNESVGRHLASSAYDRVLLNLNKGPDPRAIADRAAAKID